MDQPADQPGPQPSLLLGLPDPVLHALVCEVSSATKLVLMRTCKQTREAVLHLAPKIKFSIQEDKPGMQSGAVLAALLASRETALTLDLQVSEASDVGATQLLAQLGTQGYPASTPCGCVRELTISFEACRNDDAADSGSKSTASDGSHEGDSGGSNQGPLAVPWLGLVGTAFKGIRALTLATKHGPFRLHTAFFLGLAGCAHLKHLSLNSSFTSWDLGSDLAAHPEQLRAWLPHVTELRCHNSYDVCSLLPLLQGLAPQLEVLVLYYLAGHYSEECERLAAVLLSCRKLRRVTLSYLDISLLHALLSFPYLEHVEVDSINRSIPEKLPAAAAVPASSTWEELHLYEAHEDSIMAVAAIMRQADVRRLEMDSLRICMQLDNDPTDGMTQLQQAINRVVAAVPQIQIHDRLNLSVTVCEVQDPAAGAGTGGSLTPSLKQQLHGVRDALCKLADASASLRVSWAQETVGEGAAAALAQTLGPRLTLLTIHHFEGAVNIAAAFWHALSVHLPHLCDLCVARWHTTADPASDAALAHFVATYSGQPLELRIALTALCSPAALCAALGLPPVKAGPFIEVQLPLV